MYLVEPVPDGAMFIELEAAGEGNPGAGWHQPVAPAGGTSLGVSAALLFWLPAHDAKLRN